MHVHIHTCKNSNTGTSEFAQSYGDIKAVQNKTINKMSSSLPGWANNNYYAYIRVMQ